MQILSTDTAPSHEAFAYWRDVLAQHFVHLRPERAGLGPFRSVIEAQQLEGIPSHAYMRRPSAFTARYGKLPARRTISSS